MRNTISITIKALGAIREEFFDGKEEIRIILEQPMPVEKIIREKLKIDGGILMGILVNGKYEKMGHVPADGDEIALIPPIDGG